MRHDEKPARIPMFALQDRERKKTRFSTQVLPQTSDIKDATPVKWVWGERGQKWVYE